MDRSEQKHYDELVSRVGKKAAEALDNGLSVEAITSGDHKIAQATIVAAGIQVIMNMATNPLMQLFDQDAEKQVKSVLSLLLVEGFPHLLVPDSDGITPLEYAKKRLELDLQSAYAAAKGTSTNGNDAPRTAQ